MADTVLVNIPGGNQWTLVGASSGRITVSDDCYYCKSTTLPVNSLFGHRLFEGDALNYTLVNGEQLYIKSTDAIRAIVSLGGFGENAGRFDSWFDLMTKGQKAVVFQNYTEANVKNGLQYFLRELFTGVAVGSTVTVKFQTGAKPVIIKSREVSFSGSSRVDYQAIEGGTYTGGTAVAIRNENLIAPVPTTVSVTHTGTASGGTVYREKTIFGSGATTGGGSRIGTDSLGRETVLKPNTLYQVKMTNFSGSVADIQFELSWFEGTPDLPA